MRTGQLPLDDRPPRGERSCERHVGRCGVVRPPEQPVWRAIDWVSEPAEPFAGEPWQALVGGPFRQMRGEVRVERPLCGQHAQRGVPSRTSRTRVVPLLWAPQMNTGRPATSRPRPIRPGVSGAGPWWMASAHTAFDQACAASISACGAGRRGGRPAAFLAPPPGERSTS